MKYMISIAAITLLAWPPSAISTVSTKRALDRAIIVQSNPAELNRWTEEERLQQASQLIIEAENQDFAGNLAGAADLYRQALALLESVTAQPLLAKGKALYGLGFVYRYQEAYDLALPVLKEALALFELLSAEDADNTVLAYADIRMEILYLLGSVYHKKANYGTALTYYRPGLAIAQSTDRREVQAALQHNIGAVEAEIGQYEQAENTLMGGAELSEQLDNVGLRASTLNTLGWVAEQQQDLKQAIAHYRTALTLFAALQTPEAAEEIPLRETRVLNNLGMAHLKAGDYTAASNAFDRGFSLLTAQKDLEDLTERAILLNSTGSLNAANGEANQAWHAYFQALGISAQAGDKQGEIEVLLNLGRLMETQEKPDVAIFFYKQAIAKVETIRQDLQQLSKSVQQRYTLTIEDFYRNLADLLLQQNREAEALEILELLKLQEISAYLNSDRAQEAAGDLNTPSEAELLKILETLPAKTSLPDFLSHPTTAALTASTDDTPFDLKVIESLKSTLAAQPVKTAALYPLILEDRLEILLMTPDGLVKRFSTPVSQSELEKSVNKLQKSLSNKAFDAKAPAQDLYDWLIRPLDEMLEDHQIETVIYLPDGALRYVPLAAFHDGQQWLVQKYQSHNITAAAIDDLTTPNESSLSVVAGAFTDPEVTHRVKVGANPFEFSGLSAAKKEIENVSATMPETVALFDADFTHKETLAAVSVGGAFPAENRNILHLATHAKFIPGQPEDSFILFGDGEAVSMRSLREWQLPNVDLVVLSACQTANSVEGEGKEILGLGFQVRQTGAKAAIASLWAVDDSATAVLMTQFYAALSAGQTKAQALHTAQIKLIESNGFSDPYAWGAFILIGNGQ